MSEESWDEQFKQFLRKTGDDFRRAGEEVRAEAQRLLEAAMDPQKQQRVRDRLNELSQWARRSGEAVAGAMTDAASKAENAFLTATERVSEATAKVSGSMAGAGAEVRKVVVRAKKASKPKPKAKASPKAKGRPRVAAKAKAKPAKARPKSGGKRRK
jgi:DNA repair ATPase RecN